MVMSTPGAFLPPKPIIAYTLSKNLPEFRLTPARQRIMAMLTKFTQATLKEIVQEANVSHSVIQGLLKAGVLVSLERKPSPVFEDPDWLNKGPKLSKEQKLVASDLVNQLMISGFKANVLEGVPGSGKTEVYLETICKALEQGKQSLVLLPEIALSAQWLDRFKERFGCVPALWHSDLTQGQRIKTWRAIACGEAKVVVGS